MKKSEVFEEVYFDRCNELVAAAKKLGAAEYEVERWMVAVKDAEEGSKARNDAQGMLDLAREKVRRATNEKNRVWSAIHTLAKLASGMFDIDQF